MPKPGPFLLSMVLAASLLCGKAPDARGATPQAEIAATGLLFPEGTIFVGQDLYFVDYVRSSVLRVRAPIGPGSPPQTIWHQDGCGANGLVAVPNGFWVACFDRGTIVEISSTGTTLATLAQDAQGHPLGAPNDLTPDNKGGLYISDSGAGGRPGKVYHLGPDRTLREVAGGIRFANGIGLSPDGATLYVAESPTGRVLAFPVAPDLSLQPPRELIRLRDVLPKPPGGEVTPDSLRVDRHGNVFLALYDGGGVAIVSPQGRLLTHLAVLAQHHTNLAISPDGGALYVTAVDDDPNTTYRGQIIRLPNPAPP